ncbi:archaellum biogenesis protein FlaJ (TadC family) [Rhizobium sp. BK313]|uniref:hypothetical protein n=1 Tax=Rhizobium sp. BK313 TaxID=2587081 RepID=UPI0018350141|nr:archaellum biogenesis protein FlaJ (TadC family) [Rhizobium sp. BK313]
MLDASGRRMIGSIATGILLLTLLYVSQSIFAPLIFFAICHYAGLAVPGHVAALASEAFGPSHQIDRDDGRYGLHRLVRSLGVRQARAMALVNAERFQTIYVD